MLVTGASVLAWVLTGVALTSVVGLLLLCLGRFTIGALLATHAMLVVGFAVGAIARGPQLVYSPEAPWTALRRPHVLVMAGLLLIALLLRLPPSLYTDGGQDQGVYVNLAAHFVRDGRLFITDHLLERAFSGGNREQAALRPLFHVDPSVTPGNRHRAEGSLRPGMYIGDAATGTVVPQFYHLHPMWMALFWFIFGPQGSVYALTFFSVLALVTTYYLCRDLCDAPWVGVGAVAILSVNLLQVWVNRYPVSETLAQFWFAGGIWLYLRWQRTGSASEMWLSAVCFTLGLFTRFPTFFLLPAFVLAFWFGPAHRRDYTFANAVLGAHVASLAYGSAFSYPYLSGLLTAAFGIPYRWHWWQAALFLLLGLATANAVKALAQRAVWEKLSRGVLRRRSAALIAGAVCATAVFAMHLVPLTPKAAADVVLWRDPTVRIVQVSWYLTRLGLVVALVGLYMLVREHLKSHKHVLVASLLFVVLSFQFAVQFRNGYQFYYARYYVSEAILFFAIGISFAVVSLLRCPARAARATGVVLATLLATSYGLPHISNPAARVRELTGGYEMLSDVIRALPENSVTFVIVGPGLVGSVSPTIDTGLTYMMGRYALRGDDLSNVFRAAGLLSEGGTQVYLLWLSAAGFTDSGGPDVTVTPVASGCGTLLVSETALRVPRQTVTCLLPWGLYQLRRHP